MKIALLIDEYLNPHAGTERQLLLLARGLLEHGHEVRLGVLRSTEFVRSKPLPFEVETLSITRASDPRSWHTMYRWGRDLAQADFNVVHIFFNDASIIAPWPLKLAGLSVVVGRRDMGFWYTPLSLLLLRLAGPAINAVVANSRAVGYFACRKEWLPKRKLHVIHNGTSNLPRRSAADIPPAPSGGRIGIVANIRPVKRIADLIDAFAQIVPLHDETELVIIGDGDLRPLKARAMELGIAPRVRFTGQIAEPAAWVSTFAVGVLCSDTEGFSNSILEYMQAAIPVVATDTGGNPELVLEGETGLLVPVGDTAALADALHTILADRVLARSMGRNGQRRADSLFSFEGMVRKHIALYEELTGARSKRS